MDVPFAGIDSGLEELAEIHDVVESGWVAAGPMVQKFEAEFAEFIGSKYAICVNSGSSGLLLALKSLHLPPHSKVLTGACGFPATVAPILHCHLQPVFVDYALPSHNLDVDQALDVLATDPAIRAVIVAHTLGNPVDLATLRTVCLQREIALIEDCCEAVGTTYRHMPVGNWGTLGVFSFYPSHQMTALGGGGMVVTNDKTLCTRLRSLRDWGKRYDPSTYKLSHITTQYTEPLQGESFPYYWGYVYDDIGFNMKLPDANAACGRVQLRKLPQWIAQRRVHFDQLQQFLRTHADRWLPIESPPTSVPSWFGFPFTFRDPKETRRNALGDYLEAHSIRHRPFFAGNLLRQPAFRHLGTASDYPVADHLMHRSLFVGVWHRLTPLQLRTIEDTVTAWMNSPSPS